MNERESLFMSDLRALLTKHEVTLTHADSYEERPHEVYYFDGDDISIDIAEIAPMFPNC